MITRLNDLKAVAAKLKANAMKPHPATPEECREHNRAMAECGRPDLSIEPGTMVYPAEDLFLCPGHRPGQSAAARGRA